MLCRLPYYSADRYCSWFGLNFFTLLSVVILLLAPTIAGAQTFTPIYEFQGGADGASPNGVISDSEGNLYGTTSGGGQPIYGTVFKLSPSGVETVLYSFTGGVDGGEPYGALVRDAKGNLYGTTEYFGDLSVQCAGYQGCGVVFEVSPTGHEAVLHRFTGKADGGQPLAGLAMDSSGNLYGTTSVGGGDGCDYVSPGCGVVFKIDSAGKFSVLYTFTGGSDGGIPESPVTLDSSGNIYGSTTGIDSQGTIFKLNSSGQETTLLTFNGTNGTQPYGSLALNAKGNLYGATYSGGNLNDCSSSSGCGIVFELKPDGQEPILNVFTGGSDGSNPLGGVLLVNGSLYGTTASGGQGTYCCGVLFEITPDGVENVLHTFTDGADGGSPEAALTHDSKGNIYGAAGGGTYGSGVIYKFTP